MMGNCQKNYEIPFLVDDEYNLSFDGLNRTQVNPAQKPMLQSHKSFFILLAMFSHCLSSVLVRNRIIPKKSLFILRPILTYPLHWSRRISVNYRAGLMSS